MHGHQGYDDSIKMELVPHLWHPRRLRPRRKGVVVNGFAMIALSWTLTIHSRTAAAYSFVPSRGGFNPQIIQSSSNFASFHKKRPHSCIFLANSPNQHNRNQRQSPSYLVMKGPHRRRSSSDTTPAPSIPTDLPTELPANLKRHVVAKRPTLGHVVPKNSRTRHLLPNDSRQPLPQSQQQQGGSNTAQLRPQGQSRDTLRYNNPSNLRILGGTVRGRKLESPNVYLRPMMGKVREAVFSTFASFGLYDDVGGPETKGCKTRHLDIFSGSGSVGLESLSRGARHCTFVDMSPDCCGACERNVERCGFNDVWVEGGIGSGIGDEGEPAARVVCADAFRALRRPESVGIDPRSKFDVVTLCPPYEEIVYADLIEAVANSVLVKEDTVILIEYPVELGCLPHVIAKEDGGILVGVRNRKYGRTVSCDSLFCFD